MGCYQGLDGDDDEPSPNHVHTPFHHHHHHNQSLSHHHPRRRHRHHEMPDAIRAYTGRSEPVVPGSQIAAMSKVI